MHHVSAQAYGHLVEQLPHTPHSHALHRTCHRGQMHHVSAQAYGHLVEQLPHTPHSHALHRTCHLGQMHHVSAQAYGDLVEQLRLGAVQDQLQLCAGHLSGA